MKILRVCPTPLYTDRVYQKYPKPECFADAIELLRKTNLLLPGGWKQSMESLGHEVFETSFDDHVLQGLWASENNELSAFSSHSPSTALLARQIGHFKPDIVFFYAGALYRLDPKERAYLRSLCTHPFRLIGYWGDEVPPSMNIRGYFGDLDFLFVSNSSYQAYFKAQGIESVVTGNCFDPMYASYVADAERDTQTPLFAGDTGYLAPDHIHRYESLDHLLEKTPIVIRTYKRKPLVRRGNMLNYLMRAVQLCVPDFFLQRALQICYRHFPEQDRVKKALSLITKANAQGKNVISMVPGAHPLASYFTGKPSLEEKYPGRIEATPVEYGDYLRLLSSHLLNINIHRDEEHDYGNIRCFEVTGMGSLLFSDNTAKMGEYFEEGKEYVGFSGVDELIEKIHYYKAHTEEAKAIALAGQTKTHAHFTVKHRCQVMHDTITKLYVSKAA